MIRFKQNVTLVVVDHYDEETETTHEHDETFAAGEEVDLDIVDIDRGHAQLQFGDGSVAYGVPVELFEEIV